LQPEHEKFKVLLIKLLEFGFQNF